MAMPAKSPKVESKLKARESLRSLLLPIRHTKEELCTSVLIDSLPTDVLGDDVLRWVRLEAQSWEATGQPSQKFQSLVKAVLRSGDAEFGAVLSKKYFSLHLALCEKLLFSHAEATIFLSHGLLIASLCRTEGMSSAQIAKTLVARDSRVGFSRQSVESVVRALKLKRDLLPTEVETILSYDKEQEHEVFADLDLIEIAETIAARASALGFKGEIGAALNTLAAEDDLSRYTPYLQMLHFQCTVAEIFDHAMTDFYEFLPRGDAGNCLFKIYPKAMSPAGNPFLNNAKSVEKASMEWARSKKAAQLPGAIVLVEILEGLESMGFAARREVAALLRQFLCRVMRISVPYAKKIPARIANKKIAELFGAVAKEDSHTAGVIEQRIVDVVASALHDKPWHPRGVGDSVNATNLSKKKLGDCDFQDSGTCQVTAYEAHGGKVTAIYVDEHLRILEKTMLSRQDEWTTYSDPKAWRVVVKFVGHGSDAKLPASAPICGISVSLQYLTFDQFVKSVKIDRAFEDLFSSLVIAPLNERRTPDYVRATFLKLCGI